MFLFFAPRRTELFLPGYGAPPPPPPPPLLSRPRCRDFFVTSCALSQLASASSLPLEVNLFLSLVRRMDPITSQINGPRLPFPSFPLSAGLSVCSNPGLSLCRWPPLWNPLEPFVCSCFSTCLHSDGPKSSPPRRSAPLCFLFPSLMYEARGFPWQVTSDFPSALSCIPLCFSVEC